MIWRWQWRRWYVWRRWGQAVALGLAMAQLAPGAGAWATAPPAVALPPEWRRSADGLITDCEFADFVAAVAFVNRLVEPAERLRHHPDVAIAYGRVSLRLTTHDAGGITALDLALAREISALHGGACQRPASPPEAVVP
jgi:4a-hydroxytetrahydrobiopterin dehydratase